MCNNVCPIEVILDFIILRFIFSFQLGPFNAFHVVLSLPLNLIRYTSGSTLESNNLLKVV